MVMACVSKFYCVMKSYAIHLVVMSYKFEKVTLNRVLNANPHFSGISRQDQVIKLKLIYHPIHTKFMGIA